MSIGSVPNLTFDPLAPPRQRVTVEEYHRMIDDGRLGPDDRVELIQGEIVPKMARKPIHDGTISLIAEIFKPRIPAGWTVRLQSGITTTTSEPEPDLAIVRGQGRIYLDKHPHPNDIALVIEVADSSLEFDRKRKYRMYAEAGIPQYWIVNLRDGVLESHASPAPARQEYEDSRVLKESDEIGIDLDGVNLVIPVRDLLP